MGFSGSISRLMPLAVPSVVKFSGGKKLPRHKRLGKN
tara:strand:- start:193 stop:303 length:111 start_codon:yes stop_codon:yes gene_type:complete